ncbi:MAG TPA: hypothetical protein VEZ20_16700, partial [Allosphingosinicella sp.]|nr:hypothetical protein [Allosphingosinicella sp.]
MRMLIAALASFAALTGCAARDSGAARPAAMAATFENPVLDRDFPDPAVLRAADGFFYAYATQTAIDGRSINIQVARSRDL